MAVKFTPIPYFDRDGCALSLELRSCQDYAGFVDLWPVDVPIPSDETDRCWGGRPVADRASFARFFSMLSLGLVICLMAGCGQARQSMRNLDIHAPKPGYVQVPPCDRPQLLAGTLLSGERSLPGEAYRSRRERIEERVNCLGCGEIFWNSWHSDPPRPEDRISSYYPLEMRR